MTDIPIGIVAVLALIGAHIVWVLIPLAPALLIYWFFPNTPVAVSGPLAGLTIRTGGAFGAYLVLLVLTYGQLQAIDQSINDLKSQFWTIKGTVQLVDAKGEPVKSSKLLQKLKIRTTPDVHSIDPHEIKLRIIEERDGLPLTTVVAIQDFGEQKLLWELAEKDNFNRIIKFKEPIVIQQEASTSAPAWDLGPRLESTAVDSSVQGATIW